MSIFAFRPNIEKIVEKRDAKALAKALGHNDAKIRMAAAQAIANNAFASWVKADDFVGLLEAELCRGYVDELEKAAQALGALGESHGVQIFVARGMNEVPVRKSSPTSYSIAYLLINAIKENEDEYVRQALIKALKAMGLPARDAIRDEINNPSCGETEHLCLAGILSEIERHLIFKIEHILDRPRLHGGMHGRSGGPDPREYAEEIEAIQVLEYIGAPAIDLLLKRLLYISQTFDAPLYNAIVAALVKIGAPVIEPLTQKLRDNPNMRSHGGEEILAKIRQQN